MTLCECGCGRPTRIARQTHKSRGWIRGEPIRFIHGHNSSKPLGEGRYTKIDGKQKFVSRVIVEQILGKELPAKSHVHHFNGDPHNNSNENLVVCENDAYHKLLHQRQRAYEATSNAHWRNCNYCKEWDEPENMYINGRRSWHRACFNKYQQEWRTQSK